MIIRNTSKPLNKILFHKTNDYKAICRTICRPIYIVACTAIILQGCAAVVATGVAGGAVAAQDKRGNQGIFNDQSIEARIAGKISENNELAMQTHINVISYNSVVLLTGEAPNETLRTRAIDIAQKNTKIKRVYNAINVMPPTTLKSRNNDTFITSKVKFKLLGKREINGLRIKVVTENAHVFLMGLVPREQGDIAAKMASKVAGVKRVVKVFEYD